MATLEETYARVIADEQARAQFLDAVGTPGGIEAFLKERGCATDPRELARFLEGASRAASDALADEELESVSGGGCDRGLQCPYCNGWGAYRTSYTGATRHYCPNCETFYDLVDGVYVRR